jgi:hypothetical protein
MTLISTGISFSIAVAIVTGTAGVAGWRAGSADVREQPVTLNVAAITHPDRRPPLTRIGKSLMMARSV